MNRRMPRHPFNCPGHINNFTSGSIILIGLGKIRGYLQGAVYAYPQFRRYHLRQPVYITIRYIQSPAYISYSRPGCHSSKGYNLGHPVSAIAINYVFYYPVTFLKTKINVYIRHAYSFWIEKTLKQQIIFQRINSGNTQDIGNQTTCSRTPSRTHWHPILSGPIDQILNYKKVSSKPHTIDYANFVFQPLHYLQGRIRVFAGKCFPHQHIQIGLITVTGGNIEIRQVKLTKTKVYITFFSYTQAIFNKLGSIRKQSLHFRCAFHIKLTTGKTHTLGVTNHCPGLDTKQYIVNRSILFFQVMDVIAGHQGNSSFITNLVETRNYLFFFLQAMVLYLQIEVTWAKYILVIQGGSQRFTFVAGHQQTRNLTCDTAG